MHQWEGCYQIFKDFLSSESLVGKVGVPNNTFDRTSLIDLFKIRTMGDLSHLDHSKRKKHLLFFEKIEALYRFEYLNFLHECAEILGVMRVTCAQILSSDK